MFRETRRKRQLLSEKESIAVPANAAAIAKDKADEKIKERRLDKDNNTLIGSTRERPLDTDYEIIEIDE